jgi:hypothetical protein
MAAVAVVAQMALILLVPELVLEAHLVVGAGVDPMTQEHQHPMAARAHFE